MISGPDSHGYQRLFTIMFEIFANGRNQNGNQSHRFRGVAACNFFEGGGGHHVEDFLNQHSDGRFSGISRGSLRFPGGGSV